jgi:predicted nucleotide-binding protein
MTHQEAKDRLEDRIEKGRELRAQTPNSAEQYESTKNEFSKWNAFNTELLKRMFTSEQFANEYSSWGLPIVMAVRPPSIGERIADLLKEIDGKLHKLDSIKERLELIPIARETALPTPAAPRESGLRRTNKVFVVHGHDEASKTALEVFLRELGLEPIVLHRQADEGQTIIEKFEKHSDVGYAFILLTPDEVAYIATEETKPDDERKKEKRARPNVIFEFGYFVGKLGRSRVCCLYTGDVALPSDVGGMIYKKYTHSVEEVAFGIIKDLKASGFQIAMA